MIQPGQLVRHRLPDQSLWPDVVFKDQRFSGLGWQLRYGDAEGFVLLEAASVVSAYESLLSDEAFTDEQAVQKLRWLRAVRRFGCGDRHCTAVRPCCPHERADYRHPCTGCNGGKA